MHFHHGLKVCCFCTGTVYKYFQHIGMVILVDPFLGIELGSHYKP